MKIRGFRVELEEVEKVLGQHEAVAQAVAVGWEDPIRGQQLAAYVVPARTDGQERLSTELRAYLVGLLPAHMIPAEFVTLDQIPLTINGKADRQALPPPHPSRLSSSQGPRTPDEIVLCGLFANVLGLDSVGIDDSFVALGGHSLLAARLVSRVRATLGAELDLRALLDSPTVEGLAARLRAARPAAPALRPASRPRRIPLSFAQARLWFADRFDNWGTTYNEPTAVYLRGSLDREALTAALRDVATRHESLRTLIGEADGQPYQRILDAGATPALSVASCLADGIGQAITEASRHVFELDAELPLRASLFVVSEQEQEQEQEHVLVLVLHHIASDGWSLRPLLRDLATAYEARRTTQVPGWDPLPVQYADYSLWQRELLGSRSDPGSRMSAGLAFWQGALAGLPEQLALPYDRPRPATASGRGASIRRHWAPELHQAAVQVAQNHQATLFMVLHAALAALLFRIEAGTDVPLGVPAAGRGDEALDDLVGFFVNMVVLRVDLSGDPTFTELVARVREADLAAFAHQEIPFDFVVEALRPPRSAARHPLFQVSIVLQNNAEASLALRGLKAEFRPVTTGAAKFDLSFLFRERRNDDGAAAGIEAELEYAADLFDSATAESLMLRLEKIMLAVVADPGVRVAQVDILTPPERQRVLVEWNDTAQELPYDLLPGFSQT